MRVMLLDSAIYLFHYLKQYRWHYIIEGWLRIKEKITKAQQVHNAQVQTVQTQEISADEMWSFVQKSECVISRKPRNARRTQDTEAMPPR